MKYGAKVTLTRDHILDACTFNPEWVAGTMLGLMAELNRFEPTVDAELFGPDDLRLSRGEITVWLRTEDGPS